MSNNTRDGRKERFVGNSQWYETKTVQLPNGKTVEISKQSDRIIDAYEAAFAQVSPLVESGEIDGKEGNERMFRLGGELLAPYDEKGLGMSAGGFRAKVDEIRRQQRKHFDNAIAALSKKIEAVGGIDTEEAYPIVKKIDELKQSKKDHDFVYFSERKSASTDDEASREAMIAALGLADILG